MKTRNLIIAAVLVFASAFMAEAQVGKRYYIDLGWQFNVSMDNPFVTNGSGWGAYAEGGYYFLPRLAAGAFISYNTNNEHFGKKTYELPDGASVTTDKYHSLFQLPFGATLRCRFLWKKLQPYVEAKIGANYAREVRLFSTSSAVDSQWGFYISPEIGLTWHPFNRSNIGFQLGVYYSYATNRLDAFSIKGITNTGFKVGLSF